MPNSKIISVSNLTKIYNEEAKAVDNVSFEVQRGEIFGIIGTSGCGKTTILKTINRIIEPTSGKIFINGKDTSSLNVYELRRSIGYVIQKGGLFPHMTIEENISVMERIENNPKKETKERVDYLLNKVFLDPAQYAGRYPRELSGGQQQRVSIARALMSKPDVLLMDEPFGALDPVTRAHMHDELIRLNEEIGRTIILVTHDIIEAFKLCNTIVLMSEGKVVQMGSKQDFLKRPQNEFAKEFVNAQLDGIMENIS